MIVHGEGYEGVILPADKPWMPTPRDVAEAETRLRGFLQSSPATAYEAIDEKEWILKELPNYKRQYVGVVIDGEKQIFINAFCRSDSLDWKQEMVFVLDGGSCYFRIYYSIGSKSFSRLEVNGRG